MRLPVSAVLCSVLIAAVCTQVYAKPAKAKSKTKTKAETENPDSSWTIGAQAGEGTAEFYGDVLVPVYLTKSGAYLLNVRGSGNDNDEEEVNAGLVYRHLFPAKDVILGANIFYDSRWTAHDNQFDQMGVGLELLSRWIDARANLYLPEDKEELVDSYTEQTVEQRSSGGWNDPYAEANQIAQDYYRRTEVTTTTYLYERFEKAREGWDAELGVKLPLPEALGEYRLFAGYYNWDAEYSGQDEISGFKARAEARVLPALYLDASWYEDKDLNGSDWFVGARLNLPFDMSRLAKGKNPFAGAFSRPKSAPFAARMFEMVIRDLKVQTEDSGYVENEEARSVDVKRSSSSSSVVLMDNLTFVDDNNGSGIENGTAEHPYNTIQEGVNAANSPVYVFDGTYNENVVMRVNVDLYGEGYGIPGMGGRMFGGQSYPTANGRSGGPTFTMVNNSSITGMRILNSDVPGAPGIFEMIDGTPYDISRVGVFGHDANNILIRQNMIGRSQHGIFLGVDSTPDYIASLQGNHISGAFNDGVRVEAVGAGGTFTLLSSGNSYSGNGSDGIDIDVTAFDDVLLSFAGDRASGNGSDGLDMDNADGNAGLVIEMRNSVANNNGGEGFEMGGVDGNGSFQGYFEGLTGEGNQEEGFDLEVYAPGPILAVVADSSFNNNFGYGIQMNLESDFVAVGLIGPDAAVFGTISSLIGSGWVTPQMSAFTGPGPVTANGNGRDGMSIDVVADDVAFAGILDARAGGNVLNGIQLDVESANGLAAALAMPSSDLMNVINLGGSTLLPLLGGPAMSAFPDAADLGPIRVNGNGGCGIFSEVEGPVALSAFWNVQANGNADLGVYSDTYSGDFLAMGLMGAIEAQRNGIAGIGNIVQAPEVAIGIILDSQANNNAGPGIAMDVESPNGIAIGLISSVRSLLSGAEALLPALGLGPVNLPSYSQGSGTVANGNDGPGILTMVFGDDGAFLGMSDVTANHNENAPGIMALMLGQNGPALAGFADVTANGNDEEGIFLLGMAMDSVIGAFFNVNASGNGGNGIEAMLESMSDDVITIAAGVTASGNGLNGIDIDQTAADDVYGLYTDLELMGNGIHGMNLDSSAADSMLLLFGDNQVSDYFTALGIGLPPGLLALIPEGGGIASFNGGYGLNIFNNAPSWGVIINNMNLDNNVAGDWDITF